MCLDVYLALHVFFSIFNVLDALAGNPANPFTNFIVRGSYLSDILVGFSIGEVSDEDLALCLGRVHDCQPLLREDVPSLLMS